MTDYSELLSRVRAVLDGVTEGPWTCNVTHSDDPNGDEYHSDVEIIADNGFYIHGHDLGYFEDTDASIVANARFIASARDDVPALADALESVIAERDALAAAKWADKHTDTMNDMVLMGMAIDEAIAENAAFRARVAELEGSLGIVADQLGEGIHAGLRRLCDSPQSGQAWAAIREMPDKEWSNVIEAFLDYAGVRAAMRAKKDQP